MPILIVYGVPNKTSQKMLDTFERILKQEVSYVSQLGVKKEEVSVFFPEDLKCQVLGEEKIIVFVEGLIEKPEITSEIRKTLAVNLVNKIHSCFVEINLIECFVRPFN